ncbi:MAG TPA: hypothetical protein VIU61_16420 [Kofleriaceae bacterium]
MPFKAWLDARHGSTLAEAWAALAAKQVEVGAPSWRIPLHGAAQFAAAFLDWPLDRLAWLGGPDNKMPAPTFKVPGERSTARCFLELGLDRRDCNESWTIREITERSRGIQLVTIYCHYDDGTRGGGYTTQSVVRVFDRRTRTGASLGIDARAVATIGEVDLAPLDLFELVTTFHLTSWTRYDPDGVRGIVAQLAAEIDAHFDVSTEWPSAISSRNGFTIHRFESGPRAVELVERHIANEGGVHATVHGLPWGHGLTLNVSDTALGTYGNVTLRLPLATGQAVFGHLTRVPGIVVG